VNGNAWGKDESVDNKGTCAAGKDGNRKVVVATSDVSVPTVCFKSCDACVNLTPKPDLTCEAKAIICDPFKSYPNGYLAAGTAAHWSVWDDDYATASPISITNTEFASDTKAMVIDYALAKPQQDAILKLGDATTGRYRLDWKMYVPTRLLRDTARSFAYYNLQHDITGSHNFSADVFFLSNKVAQFQIGSTTIARISYTPDSWMNISHDINIDKDTVIVSVGTQKVGWKWSRGINGATGASAPSKKLGGVDFYALKDSTKYYIDDVQFVKIPDPTTKVTFSVDMKNEKVDAAKGVCVAGSFQKAAGFPADWTPGTTKLVNKVGTTVWEVTLDLPVGKYEYKFINDDSWSGKEEKMNGKACEAGTSGNRSFSLATLTPITVGALCYNYCVTCDKVIATNDPKFDAAMSLYPNPSQDVINLDYNFATSVSLKVSVLNILGETVYTADMPEVNAGTATMDVHNLTSGAYMMRITDENNRQTVKRFVIER
jgi:hypothetical protein